MSYFDYSLDVRNAAMAAEYCSETPRHAICSAILAERKRCADIAKLAADMVVGGSLGGANGPEHQRGCKDAGAWIWTEIMEPVR